MSKQYDEDHCKNCGKPIFRCDVVLYHGLCIGCHMKEMEKIESEIEGEK